jgi:hypothetical protein
MILALAMQSLDPALVVKLVAVVHDPVTVPPVTLVKTKPCGAVQAPSAVVQAWNFILWMAADVPGIRLKV